MAVLRRLWLIVVLATVVVLLVAGVVSVRDELRLLDDDIESDHEQLGRSLALAVGYALDRSDHAFAQELIAAADQDDPDIDIGLVPAPGAAERIAADADDQFVTVVPVRCALCTSEVIRIVERVGARDRHVLGIVIRRLIVGLTLAMIFGVALMGFGVVAIARPLRRLVRQAERIGEGDLAVEEPPGHVDEISELAHALNRMSTQLANARTRVAEEYERRLEIVQQLRHSERLATVGQLAAGVAHELGTPLNVVRGRAELMLETPHLPGDVAQSATTIIHQVERMTTIIRQLLGYARKGEDEWASVDVNAVAQHACIMLTTLADERGVSIVCRTEAEAIFVEADDTLLEQALTNLIVNALDASSRGAAVRVRAGRVRSKDPIDPGAEERSYAVLVVEDEGCGVPPSLRGRLFEPFFTTKEVGKGTGLGLCIAHSIVKEHGGFFRVDSAEGAGARFIIHIPEDAQRSVAKVA